MLRASRPEPIRVSCRTRLARMRATSGGALKPAPANRSALFSRRASAAVCASEAESASV